MFVSLKLKQRAKDIGFDLVGISPVEAGNDLEFSRRWVKKGFGGEMHYLNNPRRDDPRRVLPTAKSVVCAGLVYNAPLPYSTEARSQKHPVRRKALAGPGQGSNFDSRVSSGAGVPLRGWISRYAWGRDYHESMRVKLQALRQSIEELAPGTETRVFVDTGPVVERAFARFSGMGWMGKNTCLINEHKGSWFFLGVILTSLELEPDAPAPDRCGSCTRCLEACPTGALVEPYVMDASRCIAYFNIELKGSVPVAFRSAIGNNVFGCDICQDVCPWNSERRRQASEDSRPNPGLAASAVSAQQPAKGYGRLGAASTSLAEFQPLEIQLQREAAHQGQPADERASDVRFRFSLFNPSLEDLASLTEEDFRRVFRQSPIQRVKYRGWLRNLCVAMGNSGDVRFLPRLKELSHHADSVVREHAAWALERIDHLFTSA